MPASLLLQHAPALADNGSCNGKFSEAIVLVLQVATEHMTRLDMIPDIDASSMQVTVRGSPSAVGLPVVVQIGNADTPVGGASSLQGCG